MDRFGGAVWIERDGNAVTVVKAPSEAALGDVYAPADLMAANAAHGTATAD